MRPITPVRVAASGRFVNYETLVDSGADVSVMDFELGERLGLDVLAGTARRSASPGTPGGTTCTTCS